MNRVTKRTWLMGVFIAVLLGGIIAIVCVITKRKKNA